MELRPVVESNPPSLDLSDRVNRVLLLALTDRPRLELCIASGIASELVFPGPQGLLLSLMGWPFSRPFALVSPYHASLPRSHHYCSNLGI